ncbi:hypothetical protein AC249_AIPGENE16535 [Exaiptasia diaphana]|nr:hypothetical protein AC249_AIPGENE16535 [Exaiptasia diaphana]
MPLKIPGPLADWSRLTIANLMRPAVRGESIAGARNPDGWRLSLGLALLIENGCLMFRIILSLEKRTLPAKARIEDFYQANNNN